MVAQIDLLPDAPTRNSTAVVFVEKANAFVAALDPFGTEANALAVEVNSLATSAESSKLLAEASASAASDSAASAAAVVGVDPWEDSPTSYDFPDPVVGSNGHTYRCVGTGVVGDDPVGSVTGDWVQVTVSPLAGLITFQGLFFGGF